MAWNGSGTYTATDGTYTGAVFAQQAGDGTAEVKSSEFDLLLDDIETAINNCLTKNGENALTADADAGGSYHWTNLANGSATGDSGTWDKDLASAALDGLTLELTLNDGTVVSVDLTAVNAGTSGMDLTSAQTASGQKEFSALTEFAHIKNNGPVTEAVQVEASATSITIDTTAGQAHYNVLTANTDVTFTWPTAATDSELGANWSVSGRILFRNTGAFTVTLNSTMLAALDYYSEEGAEATGSGELSTLAYHYQYINGDKICQFAWVSTTS